MTSQVAAAGGFAVVFLVYACTSSPATERADACPTNSTCAISDASLDGNREPDGTVDAGPAGPDGRGDDQGPSADVGTGPDAPDDATGDDSGPITFANVVACTSMYTGSVVCAACNGMGVGMVCQVNWAEGGCNSGDTFVANCAAGTQCAVYALQGSTPGTCSPCVVAEGNLPPDASIPQCVSGAAVICNAVPPGCAHAEGPYWCCEDAGAYQ